MSRALVVAMVIALTGCIQAPKRLAYARVGAAPTGEPPETCPATLRIRVVDTAGDPVASAEVTLHQREQMNAPSMVPSDNHYRTEPVLTDVKGDAWVCRPARMPTHDGERYFTRYDGGHVEARLGERHGRLSPPFDAPLVLRTGPASPFLP